MAFSVSPIVTNLYMDEVEKKDVEDDSVQIIDRDRLNR